MVPSNKHRTLTCDTNGHFNHNLIAAEIKLVEKKYSNKGTMKITHNSSSEIVMITYHNGGYLETANDKILKFYMNNFLLIRQNLF